MKTVSMNYVLDSFNYFKSYILIDIVFVDIELVITRKH